MMMFLMMMMMMPTKIFSKMYFVWTREILIGQQARTRIRRAFGDDDGNKDDVFFFFTREVVVMGHSPFKVKAKGVSFF